ncbi:cation-transporting ATPase pacS, partial [human gut metagenome]
MSNIITKAHPVPDMHSTGLRVVGAWLFAIVLILFSTVFVHVPYTREIQMVL